MGSSEATGELLTRKMPAPSEMPTVLAVAYVSDCGPDDAFAIVRPPTGTPVRYSWISARFGAVDLYSVDGFVNDDGEPEVRELRYNICPIERPRYSDELGRRVFQLAFPCPKIAHPAWLGVKPAVDA
jgi:hypothetical protein